MSKIKFLRTPFILLLLFLCQHNWCHAQSCDLKSGAILFNGSDTLSSDAKKQLSQLATAMRASPNCKVVVQGNGSTKPAQQFSWECATNIIDYLSENENIIRDRFIIMIGGKGEEKQVNYRPAGDAEEGPSTMPPPYPQYRR